MGVGGGEGPPIQGPINLSSCASTQSGSFRRSNCAHGVGVSAEQIPEKTRTDATEIQQRVQVSTCR